MTKHIIILRFLVLPLLCSLWANAQVGYGTAAPNKASVIDMQSSSKGLMVPRIALQGATIFGPITGGASYNTINANSMLVYNTTNNTSQNLTPGYYYWSQTTATDGKWNALAVISVGANNLTGDITGSTGTTYLSKIQGKIINLTSPADNQAITYDSNASTWKPAAYTAITVTAENMTATGNATPANNPTQNISFSPAANATGATVKAIGLQVKDGAVTMDKLGSGTAVAGQGLISKGGSVAAMGTVGIKAVAGALSTSGGSIVSGSASDDTGASITLGPGKWMIFLGSSIGTNAALVAPAGVFVSIIVSGSQGGTTPTADRITEISGPYAGGVLFSNSIRKTFVNGSFAVNNTTSGNKTYYITMLGSGLTSTAITSFGSGYWERHMFAMKIN